MGILEKLGKSIKKAGKTIAEEVKTRREISRTKRRILDRFEIKDLKDICKDYGIGEPSPYEEDFLTGEKSRRTVTREHYIDWIIERLSLDQIKNFCDKRRIKIWDIVEEKVPEPTPIVVEEVIRPVIVEKRGVEEQPQVTQMEVKKSEFDLVLDSIKKEFEPEDVRDENEFEKQLFQFLKIKYPDRARRQIDTPKGKIDIVIDNRYAIELKIADSKGKLMVLYGQVINYKKIYRDVAVVLLDVGKMPHHEIKEYIDGYRNLGAKVIILRGTLKRKGRRERQIIIKD